MVLFLIVWWVFFLEVIIWVCFVSKFMILVLFVKVFFGKVKFGIFVVMVFSLFFDKLSSCFLFVFWLKSNFVILSIEW